MGEIISEHAKHTYDAILQILDENYEFVECNNVF